jgi:hypothetical protein
MKLLDTSGGNTKIAKTNKEASIRYAGLSLMPTPELCPNSKAAGCFDGCLKFAGRGKMSNVKAGRLRKTNWLMSDTKGFMAQLRKELSNFEKLCIRNGQQPVVRLNTISDFNWRDVKADFPRIIFLDYTKVANRIKRKLPNERYVFSYSGEPKFQPEVERALALPDQPPIAVVFKGDFPKTFLGRPVIDGDKSDWVNANTKGVIVGLTAKGDLAKSQGLFAVDTNLISMINLK